MKQNLQIRSFNILNWIDITQRIFTSTPQVLPGIVSKLHTYLLIFCNAYNAIARKLIEPQHFNVILSSKYFTIMFMSRFVLEIYKIHWNKEAKYGIYILEKVCIYLCIWSEVFKASYWIWLPNFDYFHSELNFPSLSETSSLGVNGHVIFFTMTF